MKKSLVVGIVALFVSAVAGVCFARDMTLNGAGASFPYPIYSKWAYKYHSTTRVRVNYQSIGSGGGIRQIKAKTVDFGASDAPLKPEELEESGLLQFPMIMGGVVPVVNIPGVETGGLRLTPSLLSGIFMGNITYWDDPGIKKANPGVELPHLKITVVHRADGSGTTWIFTNYLAKVSNEWKTRVGFGKAVSWPAGVGGKGNEGVAAYTKRIRGAIGYVEYAYALENSIPYALLENRAGRFVAPSMETFQAAAANARWKEARGYYLVLTDQPGDKSWPITGASFILVHKEQRDAEKAKEMLKFFEWCYLYGQQMAEELHYVPIPKSVVELVEATWKKELTAKGAPVWP